jgi:hypothetical protein
MRTIFSALEVGQAFMWNQTLCVKKSSRTATLVEANRWFYFRGNDVCRTV